MRKFKLWNEDKTEFIDLSSDRCLATNPKGLGIENKLEIVESNQGYYLQNRKPDNKDITMMLNFGIKGNPYETFQVFSDFVNENTFLILEYESNTVIFRDVYLRKLGKGEKTEFGTLRCELILAPNDRWYIENIYENGDEFDVRSSKVPVSVEISSSNYSGIRVTLERIISPVIEFVGEIAFPNLILNGVINGLEEKLTINSHEKRIYYDALSSIGDSYELQKRNAYGEHDPTKKSFLIIPNRGTYRVTVYGVGSASVVIKTREWVV